MLSPNCCLYIIGRIFLVRAAGGLIAWGSVYLLHQTSNTDVMGRRRPILIIGSLGVAITSVAFGLSQSLQHVIIARFLGLCINGSMSGLLILI